MDEENGIARVARDHVRDDAPSLAGEHSVADFGWSVKILRRGECHVISDTRTSPLVPPADRPASDALGIIACMGAPLIKEGRLVGALCVTSREPRGWTADEVAILQEVADRVWAAVERARAETRLHESEARFRTLVDAVEDVFYITDLEQGALEYLSPAYERIWGRPRSAIISDLQLFVESIHPADRDIVTAAKAAQARGEQVVTRYRIVRPDGGVRHIMDRSFPVSGADGRRAAGVASDVTAVTLAESRLRETEAQLLAFGEASSDLLWIRNAETLAFEYVSPAFERIFGASRDEVLQGDTLENWLRMVVPDDRARASKAIETLRTGKRLAFEYRIHRPADGQVRLLRDTGFPIRDPGGRVMWIAGVGHDATEEAASAERLKVLVAELQHRTRNLLGVVRSVTDRTLANSDGLDDFRARIHDQLGALARVNGLLSRLQEDERIDFDELIRSELDAHGVLDGAGKSAQISLSGPTGVRLRSSTVQTLALGLHELATNALKYGVLSTPDGRLEIGWSLAAGPDGLPRLTVDWRESGVAVAMPGGAEATDVPNGYGRELIEQALPYQLSAEVDYDLSAQGVRCTITIPLSTGMDMAQTAAREIQG